MKVKELKRITDKINKGTANRVEEMKYNRYVSAWGI